MKIYPNVNRFLEEISTTVASKVTIIDKSEVYQALMRAILLDGVTIEQDVVLSLDEFEDVLRDLTNKDRCCQSNTCCQAPDKTCASYEEESAEDDDQPQADSELPCGGETRCCEEEIDDSDEDDDDCEDCCCTAEAIGDVLCALLEKDIFVNGIDYTSQPDGTEHLAIENIQIS